MTKLPRFYLAPNTGLGHDFWLHEEGLLARWNNSKLRPGQEVVLFDGVAHEGLYRLEELSQTEAHLVHVTDFRRQTPDQEIYLLWALLSKDKNVQIIQQYTEQGISHFLPLLTDGPKATDFDIEQARRVAIQTAEACGRSDIPTVREPMHLAKALQQLKPDTQRIIIPPKAGWSDDEAELLRQKR